jgi:hypothetical protein
VKIIFRKNSDFNKLWDYLFSKYFNDDNSKKFFINI